MLMESASLTDIAQESISGHLLQLLMKLVLILKISVLALMSIKHHLNHLLLLEMITFVTQGALIITNTFSMVMTHYGMELVVDQPTPAAL